MADRWAAWLVGSALVLTVAAADPQGWFPYTPAKWLVLAVLLPAGLACWWSSAPPSSPTLDRRGRIAVTGGAALVALLAVAAFVAPVGRYAWWGSPERHFGVVTWAWCALALGAGLRLERRQGVGVLAAAAVVACGLLGAAATLQAVGAVPRWLAAEGRLTATVGSPAYLGAGTSLLVPLALGLSADAALPRGARRWAGLAGALGACALVGSQARAAWVGLAVATMALAVARRSRWRRSLAGRPPAQVVAGGLVVAVAAVALVVAGPVGSRVADATDPAAPGGRGRLDEWRVAARVVAAHPVVGVGPEGYRLAFHEGVDHAYEARHGRDPQPDRAHSAPLDVALAGGLPALAAWLAVVGAVGAAAWQVLRRGRGLAVGTAVGVVAYGVGQWLLFPLAEWEPFAWLAAGAVVAHAATLLAGPSTGAAPDRPAAGGPSRARRAAACLLVAWLPLGAWDGITGVLADRSAGRAVAARAAGRTGDAWRSASDAVERRPDVVRLRVLAAATAIEDQRGHHRALAHLDAALAVAPGDPIVVRDRLTSLVGRAESTGVADHRRAARAAALEAIAQDPTNAVLQRLAGVAALLEGHPAEAEAAWRTAADLAPDDPQPCALLRRLYDAQGRAGDPCGEGDGVHRPPRSR